MDPFLEATKNRVNRPWRNRTPRTFDELISGTQHLDAVAASRKLYANNGVVKGLINLKASYAIGNAFQPQFLGTDKAWGDEAKEWLRKWYSAADIKGHNLTTVFYLLSVAIDRDGDAFVLLTETDKGYPQIQVIPSFQIGNRDGQTSSNGLKLTKGVATGKNGRTVGYQLLGATEKEDQFISAANLIYIIDPEYAEASRGLPIFSHALNEFRDMALSVSYELTAQLLLGAHAFVINSETGDLPPGESDNNALCESYEDGTIRYFRANSGESMESVDNARPSQQWQDFHSRLERVAIVGTGFPKALLDDLAGTNGVANRVALAQAAKAVEDRQNLLIPHIVRMLSWAIAKAIKLDLLPPNPDFYRWNLSRPKKLTVDAGRDSNAMREEYKLGLRSLTSILEEEGKTLEDHINELRTEREAIASALTSLTLPA